MGVAAKLKRSDMEVDMKKVRKHANESIRQREEFLN